MTRVLGRTYNNETCSIAGALEVVGERWTLLIVREALFGDCHRFEDLQRRLGIARNILSVRLSRLVDEGVLERRPYPGGRERYEYHLTAKGLDLLPVMVALIGWGDKYVHPGLPPVVLIHRDCGGGIDDRRMCQVCGAKLRPSDVVARRGPGFVDSAEGGRAKRPRATRPLVQR